MGAERWLVAKSLAKSLLGACTGGVLFGTPALLTSVHRMHNSSCYGQGIIPDGPLMVLGVAGIGALIGWRKGPVVLRFSWFRNKVRYPSEHFRAAMRRRAQRERSPT